MKKKNGFTLIELIITIVLILVVILMFSNSMEGINVAQTSKSYERMVNKINVASSSLVSSKIDYSNELQFGRGFVKIRVGELIESGYLDKNLVDPRNDEPIDREQLALITLKCDGEMAYKFPVEETDNDTFFLETTPIITNSMPDNVYQNINSMGLRLISESGQTFNLTSKSKLSSPGDITVVSKTYNTYTPGVYKILYNYLDNNNICRIHYREVVMY